MGRLSRKYDLGVATKADPRIERSRAAIIAAARALLAEEGWAAVTQDRVAGRAGVGRSTVYRHFPDRTVLLVETINVIGQAMLRQPTGDLRKDLIGELDGFRRLVSGPTVGGLLATLAQGALVDCELQTAKDVTTAFYTSPLRTAVDAAIRDGRLDQGTNPDEAVAELFGPISFRILISGEPVTRRFVERLVDRFLAVSTPQSTQPARRGPDTKRGNQ